MIDRRAFLSIGAALLATGCAPGQRAIELGQELKALVDDPLQPLSGLSVLVQHRGRSVYEAQFGRRWIAPAGSGQKDLPITADTLFRVASLSKLVLGVGAMRLVDAGRLDLDADVSDVLGYRLRNPRFPDQPLTARMFLTHTSSLTDEGGLFVPAGETMQHFLATRERCWADVKPGSFFQYSNLGYGFLAGLLERASGMRFDVFMQQQVLAPLAMQGGYEATQLPPEQLANVATLYRKQGAGEKWNATGPWVAQADDFHAEPPTATPGLDGYLLGSNGSLFGPQGRLRTRVRDLGTIAAMFCAGGTLADSTTFLSKASIAAMTSERWRFDEAAKNGDNLGGRFQAWGTGLQHYIDRSAPHWGDRLLAEGGLTAWGHHGFSYGLQSGLMFEPVSQTAVIYVIGGHSADPGANRGRYSSYPAWEEQVHQRLWTRALDDRKV
ncbi:serine hydrolase domain-containing protein [Paucibacter sp. R3-3]|uniref:Serine hydrolase domain-containing protein n=1 Tax=Roseateles agri TaxID=3098619 RepID=A0ABU5DLI5_9BURK|nr:serine hydrolase domain-containing protein [Paucibacter sp. R3-3]MDY0747172.1 serine hydrolase domain-containing protein [Paucibacter sp. R3-3]